MKKYAAHFAVLMAMMAAPAMPAVQIAQQVASQKARIDEFLDGAYPRLDRLYKEIHAHPELGFAETRTAGLLAKQMRALGFDVTERVGKTGIVAIYRNGAGPTVMVRTELDALPVKELTGLPYASQAQTQWNGRSTYVMHACGHDLHMASWVGTAGALLTMKAAWRGTLMFIAQPSEESISGAEAMLKDGLFERFPKPDAAFALHNAAYAYRTVHYRPGVLTSNSDDIAIAFKGRGGHGADPSKTIDPVLMAARFVVDVQSVVSREKDPQQPGVVTIGAIEGGSAGNVIPGQVVVRGTIRNYDDGVRAKLKEGVARVARSVAAMAGAPDPDIEIGRQQADAVVNDPALTASSGEVFRAAFGDKAILDPNPITASEDYSLFVKAGVTRSLFFLIGVYDPDRIAAADRGGPPLAFNHSPHYAPVPEPTIRTGVEAMTLAVLRELMPVGSSAHSPGASKTSSKTPMYGQFGFDLAGMDTTVKPGDDFYRYANGNWDKTTEIPADRSSYGMFEKLQDLSQDRTRGILEDAALQPGSKIGDFYASFLDEASADGRGFEPVRPWLEAISATTSKSELASAMAQFQRQGVKAAPDVAVKQDDKNPGTYVAQVSQGTLGLPDRDYYLKDDPKLARVRLAYANYLAQLLALVGEDDTQSRAARIIEFETRIARSHWTRVDSRDPDKTYNEWSRTDFDVKAPGYEWSPYLAAFGLGEEKRFLVRQPSALSGEAEAWRATPIAVLKDYLVARLLARYAGYLSRPFVDADFAFAGAVLTGASKIPPRWKRGVTLVSSLMGEAVGKDYVERYFAPEAKAAADNLVRNLIAAYRLRLQSVPWMTPETRIKALEKLATFTAKIGYPDKWRDYSTLAIARDDLVGNVARAESFEYQRALNHLGQPIDRGEWRMSPMEVNAYIDFGLNEIVFPAAILQPPFFDTNADPAVNYGGIGAVIGHELSHHFDDQGRKYDQTGKLTDWWTPQDVSRFERYTDKLVRQYDAYEPLPGQHIQGALTLGENLADVAGLSAAYTAYRISLGGKPAPLIAGFTGDQRFYLGFAQIWRSKYREPRLRQQLLTNLHAPGAYRVYEVRNQDDWYQAFKVEPDEKLYLPKGDRVQIW